MSISRSAANHGLSVPKSAPANNDSSIPPSLWKLRQSRIGQQRLHQPLDVERTDSPQSEQQQQKRRESSFSQLDKEITTQDQLIRSNNTSRRGSEITGPPNANINSGRAWLQPGAKVGRAVVTDYDVAKVLSTLAERGMSAADRKHAKHSGASLIVACIDALLLKLDNGLPYELMGSSFLRRTLLPVIDATCAQLRNVDRRRSHLLQEIDALREQMLRKGDFILKLDELCESASSTYRSRKVREAAEAVEIACNQSIQEKEELETQLKLMAEHRHRLEQRLVQKRATQAEECVAWGEIREVLLAERDEQARRRNELLTKVPEMEEQLAKLESEAALLSQACCRTEQDVMALPQDEAELVKVQTEWADLTARLRQERFHLERAKGRNSGLASKSVRGSSRRTNLRSGSKKFGSD